MSSSAAWPDGRSFVPVRWLGKYKGVEADRKAFMPFSAGSRNCIGQQYDFFGFDGYLANDCRFALKELRLILANLVRNFELSLVEGQSHELRIFTTPQFKQGYYNVGIKRRV
jgi:cytochrome P450